MAETVNTTLTPIFRVHVVPNEAASKTAGRPIVDQFEVVEIRFPGDRQKVAVFPAHDNEPNATRESTARGGGPITYAMLYGTQYRQFKASEVQSVSGTPIEELPFLDAKARSELKALNIHTAEALAGLDGTPLKQLGAYGRERKNQAQAYLDNARGSADVTEMASRIAALEQAIADRDNLIQGYATKHGKTKYQKGVEQSVADQIEREAEAAEDEPADPAPAAATGDKALEDCSNEELRAYIKRETGHGVKGNPSRENLLAAALDVAQSQAPAEAE